MKSDDEGETPMTIFSGFLGMKVDKEKDNLVTAEIGWYVKGKSGNNEDDNNNPFGFHRYRPLRPLGHDESDSE